MTKIIMLFQKMEVLLQHLHLSLNKVSSKKKALLLLFTSIFLTFSFTSEQEEVLPKINKEIVRKDILTHYKDFFDEEYFKNRDTSMFFVHYLDGYCLVHIPYRINNLSEKASIIAIYHLTNKNWEYQCVIPYYSSLELINPEKKFFLSDNEYCEANMSCNSFIEVSEFVENNMLPILNYYGFNYEVYFDDLIRSGDVSSVIKAKGDTIKNQVYLSDFTFDNKGLKSYKLERKIGILTDNKKDSHGYDSLVIKQVTIERVINYKNL